MEWGVNKRVCTLQVDNRISCTKFRCGWNWNRRDVCRKMHHIIYLKCISLGGTLSHGSHFFFYFKNFEKLTTLNRVETGCWYQILSIQVSFSLTLIFCHNNLFQRKKKVFYVLLFVNLLFVEYRTNENTIFFCSFFTMIYIVSETVFYFPYNKIYATDFKHTGAIQIFMWGNCAQQIKWKFFFFWLFGAAVVATIVKREKKLKFHQIQAAEFQHEHYLIS